MIAAQNSTVPAMPRGGMLSGGTPSAAPAGGMVSGNNNVTTENGRIVYNRNYGNIPKGSYGGETYTVKRGDTLFYIAGLPAMISAIWHSAIISRRPIA